ncbi:multidrug ABC transporter permease [Elizabethkingia anophelis]|uniref:ABC transporter permease n=1 Tax=Chryseobacterium salviniae TaxID=3101750 RepID=A0ABU6HRY8_9FLAO|nr:ABC transporter permease [Chryseobacterium sp. T9W2-O]MDV3557888.1 multidrug ABC transporter permease [Elizabethkingia anophelis]MDV3567588.1 multidrug ABC transporter permease [Elizabethkingia anophelis]MEC3875213.1 ABC transporter permease [Chryseobacterium sp. T9W2-O]
MKQFLSFVRKEFYHVFRDSKTLLMLFGLPIVQIVLFGFALTNEIKNSKIVICDYAKDEATQQIISKIEASRNFEIQKTLISHKQIEEAFKEGNIKLAIIFPANFNKDLLHLNKAQVQIIADASDPNTANTLTNYATNIIMDYQQELMKNKAMPFRIVPELRMLYNPELKGATNFVPGVMALVLMLICVMMTAVSVVKEKETGTMEVLLVSPFNPFLVIISKAIPYLFLSLINLTIILVLSVTLLDMPINGSILLLFGASTLLIITALSLGLLISNVTQSQQTAMLISMMGMMLPTMLFTGFMFPLENMPYPLQIIANAVPSKWYYIIVKSIMIKGLGFSAIWKETLILFGMTCFLLIVSIRKFKIRLV